MECYPEKDLDRIEYSKFDTAKSNQAFQYHDANNLVFYCIIRKIGIDELEEEKPMSCISDTGRRLRL